jgi:hypothetical protein
MSLSIGEKSTVYNHAAFAVATATTDYDVEANNASTWLADIKAASGFAACGKIRLVTDQTITVKFNSTTADGIVVTSSESPFIVDDLVIRNMFITNTSGSTANVKLSQFLI